MKKNYFKSLMYCAVMISLISCTEEGPKDEVTPDKEVLPTVEVTVKDKDGKIVAGAQVSLYKNPEDYTSGVNALKSTTSSAGIAVFTDSLVGKYYISATKDTEKSDFTGLDEDGIFDSQAEINESAVQQGATVGGVKYKDANGDGWINNDDEVYLHSIEINPSVKAVYTITIHPAKVEEIPSLEVTVTDMDGNTISDVNVYLYLDPENHYAGNATVEGTTDATGKATFSALTDKEDRYYIYAEKNGVKSIFKGLMEEGTFQSQAEIDESSVYQPDATVGGPKYKDVNTDGVIDSNDEVYLDSIRVYSNTLTTYTIKIRPVQ